MVFSNAVFLFLFLPVAIGVYYIPFVRKNTRVANVWLLLISLFFYAWGEPVYVFLMILSILANYIFGILVSKYPKSSKGKVIVFFATVFNIGLLFVFKYLGWVLGLLGQNGGFISKLALPIGISFYTFQALSYVIDVYRKKADGQRNIIYLGLYIAFFPQLIAGPIVRYNTIAEQIKKREHSFDKFGEGTRRFIIGLAKKILLSNQLAAVADLAFEHTGSELTVVMSWIGALSFMLQIYFDFSGYSDMAIGLGKMFGFDFNENFNYPYISTSISEYWRRWHISLGEWFRDYLYYPLSIGPSIKLRKKLSKRISRKATGIICTFFVLFVTWMATGLWHGANLTFVVWGLIQFICIFAEQYRKPLKNKKLGLFIGYITTMFIVLITKVIFRADNLKQAFVYYSDMLGLSGNKFINGFTVYWIKQYAVIIIAAMILALPVIPALDKLCAKNGAVLKIWGIAKTVLLILLMILSFSFAITGGYNPFIYFNF